MFKNVGIEPNDAFAATIPFALLLCFSYDCHYHSCANAGGLAERVRFSSLMLFLVLFSLFIYSPLAHWTWHPEGFLRKWGVLDFTVVL